MHLCNMLNNRKKKFTLDRGQIVKKAINESGISKRAVAKSVGKDYATLYNWFKDQDLSLDKIIQVGRAIKYDFSNEIPEISSMVSEAEPSGYFRNSLADCIKKYDELQARYNELVDKYTSILELQAQLKPSTEPTAGHVSIN